MRLQQALKTCGDVKQLGTEDADKNYKNLNAISFTKEGLPVLSFAANALK